ncbi:MAG: hypothetical protein E6J34_11695 [Chloroflexi bacterium]|nr:MAG: hypothetical protein E6J34_11695 [Chloroflexota bacterium]
MGTPRTPPGDGSPLDPRLRLMRIGQPQGIAPTMVRNTSQADSYHCRGNPLWLPCRRRRLCAGLFDWYCPSWLPCRRKRRCGYAYLTGIVPRGCPAAASGGVATLI